MNGVGVWLKKSFHPATIWVETFVGWVKPTEYFLITVITLSPVKRYTRINNGCAIARNKRFIQKPLRIPNDIRPGINQRSRVAVIVIPSHPLEVIQINEERHPDRIVPLPDVIPFQWAADGGAQAEVAIHGDPARGLEAEIGAPDAAYDDLQHDDGHDERAGITRQEHEPEFDRVALHTDSVLVVGLNPLNRADNVMRCKPLGLDRIGEEYVAPDGDPDVTRERRDQQAAIGGSRPAERASDGFADNPVIYQTHGGELVAARQMNGRAIRTIRVEHFIRKVQLGAGDGLIRDGAELVVIRAHENKPNGMGLVREGQLVDPRVWKRLLVLEKTGERIPSVGAWQHLTTCLLEDTSRSSRDQLKIGFFSNLQLELSRYCHNVMRRNHIQTTICAKRK